MDATECIWMSMEICHKNEYDRGAVKLQPNVKADLSYVDEDVLKHVHPDDEKFMILVLNYCATTIGRKHKDLKTCIFPTRHRDSGEMMLYTVYVSLPISTVIDDEHSAYLKAISPGRIDRSIRTVCDPNVLPLMWRMEIVINALANISQYETISITNIHMTKKKNQINIIYDKDADDDQRGSTKRTRHNSEHDK